MDCLLAAVLVIMAVAFAVGFVAIPIIMVRMIRLWAKAGRARVPVTAMGLVRMWSLGVSPTAVVDACIRLGPSGVRVTADKLTKHALARGHVGRVADWVVAARAARFTPHWSKAAALDLTHALRDLQDVPKDDREDVFRRISEGQSASK